MQGELGPVTVMFCIIDVDMTVPVSSVMPADNFTYHNMEASKFMNRADHVYSSMVEVMYKKHEKGSKNAQGVPEDHAILMFLLCGILLTTGWGGITARLMVAMRFGMRDQQY